MGAEMIFLYICIAIQMIGWAWFSWRGGKLSDREFIVFTLSMVGGQVAVGVETAIAHAWGALTMQTYFFLFTSVAGVRRYLQMRKLS